MLTRLKINGFKNLVNVDVRFGAFTCIAGTNGVGKSNLFDAIRFLSALADQPLMEAASSVRGGKNSDVKSLFHRVGEHYDSKMFFEAEMIIPDKSADDLGQEAEASVRFVRYTLELGLRTDEALLLPSGLEILKEELVHITKGDAPRHLLFPHSLEWRNSILSGRQSTKFISTEHDGAGRAVVQLHQNRSGSEGAGGRAAPRLASALPRTVLSVTNAAENRTALCTRREMQSWRLLQLEPTALREPDQFSAPPRLGSDGAHLAATLYRLARTRQEVTGNVDEERLYAQLANRLSDLIDDVHKISVDQDIKRELLTLYVAGKDKTSHPARALSDGTLRFLALATIDLDPEAQGLLCLEEPENGIHPARIPAMVKLLQDIAVDTELPVGTDNPLRQVIVNTHSPAVVSEVADNTLLVALSEQGKDQGRTFRKTVFGCLPRTWREDSAYLSESPIVVPKGTLISYLNPHAPAEMTMHSSSGNGSSSGNHVVKSGAGKKNTGRSVRVIDRPDLQLMLSLSEN